MKTTLVSRLALILVVATASFAAAKPGNKPDCSASLPAVQAAVEAAPCDCATAVNHGQFVRCAGGVVKGMAKDGSLPKNCKGAMVRVFAKSTCGKPDHVTCCLSTGCSVKMSAVCTLRGGTEGSSAFCTDACTASPSGAFLQ